MENKERVDITNQEVVEIELSDEAVKNLEEAQAMAKMPKYMVCEHTQEYYQKEVSIFNLNLEELVYEKMFLLFEKYLVANSNLEDSEAKLKIETDKLLLETDFREVLGKSRTNKEEREAYVKKHTSQFVDAINDDKVDVEFYKTKLEIINDLIKMRRLELRIETALQEEDE